MARKQRKQHRYDIGAGGAADGATLRARWKLGSITAAIRQALARSVADDPPVADVAALVADVESAKEVLWRAVPPVGHGREALLLADHCRIAVADLVDYKRRLQAISNSYAKLEADRDGYKRSLAECASERDGMQETVLTLRAERDALQEDVATLRDRIREMEEVHHNTVEAQTALRREALATLVEAGLCDRDTMPLQAGVNQARDRFHRVREDVKALEAHIDALKAREKERNDHFEKSQREAVQALVEAGLCDEWKAVDTLSAKIAQAVENYQWSVTNWGRLQDDRDRIKRQAERDVESARVRWMMWTCLSFAAGASLAVLALVAFGGFWQ